MAGLVTPSVVIVLFPSTIPIWATRLQPSLLSPDFLPPPLSSCPRSIFLFCALALLKGRLKNLRRVWTRSPNSEGFRARFIVTFSSLSFCCAWSFSRDPRYWGLCLQKHADGALSFAFLSGCFHDSFPWSSSESFFSSSHSVSLIFRYYLLSSVCLTFFSSDLFLPPFLPFFFFFSPFFSPDPVSFFRALFSFFLLYLPLFSPPFFSAFLFFLFSSFLPFLLFCCIFFSWFLHLSPPLFHFHFGLCCAQLEKLHQTKVSGPDRASWGLFNF